MKSQILLVLYLIAIFLDSISAQSFFSTGRWDLFNNNWSTRPTHSSEHYFKHDVRPSVRLNFSESSKTKQISSLNKSILQR